MNYLVSVLTSFDAMCGSLAAALQHAAPQLYPTLALAVVIGFIVLPRRNDEP